MHRKVKSVLSKINFALGRSPKIEKISDKTTYIPEPYKAVVTITADFELAWAWRYSKSVPNPLERAHKKAKLERENLPVILELCEKYNIPITWATVGHLFLDKCDKNHGLVHPEIIRLSNFENKYWRFSSVDWFEHDPGSNYLKAPEWYCPDLIDSILSSDVGHEIGCHTFSHIDCRDEVCPKEVFNSEINMCINLASKKGIKLTSFVHPGHTIGNLDNLANLGFTSFQTDPGNILGFPVKHKNGLWEIKRTSELAENPEWTIDYQIKRYKSIIKRAIKSHTVCNLWFHPSFGTSFLAEVFPEILQFLNDNSESIIIMTISDYVDYLAGIHE